MRKSSVCVEVAPRFVSIAGFMQFCGLGKSAAAELGERIGCRRKFGSRTMYDLKIADEFFDTHKNEGVEVGA